MSERGTALSHDPARARSTMDVRRETGLLGIFAMVAVFCFGAAMVGPSLAADCTVTGVVEEVAFTGFLFPLLRYGFKVRMRRPTIHTVGVFGQETEMLDQKERTRLSQISLTSMHLTAPSSLQTFPVSACPLLTDRCRASAIAALVTALLFALCHMAQPWKAPFAFVFSLGMVGLYCRTKSIWWPICAHSAFDMCWFGLLGLP